MTDSLPRQLNSELVKEVLSSAGKTQKDLALELEVSSQAVTNWLKGKDFPRPPKLLKLAMVLSLPVDKLVLSVDAALPIVAFRKKGSSKTTEDHVKSAQHTGTLLRPLAQFLPNLNIIRPVFSSSVLDEQAITAAANQTRAKLEIGPNKAVKYADLISEFANSDAVLVPVMWGPKEKHKNALHIHLPAEDVTFIFLNLDTRIEDFKFWMAHELAHVYTPHLSGKDEGEDFADAFAGKFLFSDSLAKSTYKKLASERLMSEKKSVLLAAAEKHKISVFTVYSQVKKYAKQHKLADIGIAETSIHKLRNTGTSELVSDIIFNGKRPTAKKYIKECEDKFGTDFFDALRHMIKEQGVASGYLQQIMSISPVEAKELYQVLM